MLEGLRSFDEPVRRLASSAARAVAALSRRGAASARTLGPDASKPTRSTTCSPTCASWCATPTQLLEEWEARAKETAMPRLFRRRAVSSSGARSERRNKCGERRKKLSTRASRPRRAELQSLVRALAHGDYRGSLLWCVRIPKIRGRRAPCRRAGALPGRHERIRRPGPAARRPDRAAQRCAALWRVHHGAARPIG